jgi:AraC-like DNA-binding protein
LRLHAGISAPDDRAELPARYQAALSAAEQALYGGASFEHADPGAARGENPMAVLRRRMVQVAGENPQQISPLFARFVEAAAVHCAYRLEPTRAHLEAGFEQITDALKSTGNLDERGLGDLRGALEKNAADANTIRELAAAYQPVISDLELALQRPIGAGQDRAMRRALTFVREHLTEPLPLSKVARVAGFAPRYFAKLFVRDERVTLQQYVSALRLARAKQLLASTTLTVERVRQLSGFRTRVHFHRAFKQAFGTTPTEFRNASPP